MSTAKAPVTEQHEDLRWWTKKNPHKLVKRLVEDYRKHQSGRRARWKRMIELYGADMTPMGGAAPGSEEELAFNALRNAVDTLQSKLVQNQPLPMFTTEGGTYSEQRRAREKSRFVEGQYEELRVWELAEQWALEACVTGTGICFGYARFGRVHLERRLPVDLIVSDADARRGAPRVFYLRTPFDRGELCELFPKFREEIELAPDAKDDFFTGSSAYKPDQVWVYEAWHLPSSPTANDGWYVATLDGIATLEKRPYKRQRPPFAFYRLNTPLYGFWGPSKVSEGAPAQREYDFTMSKIQRSMKLMAHSHLAVPRSANMNVEEMDNEDGTIFEFDGNQPPIPLNFTGVSSELYQYARDIPAWMMQHMGISALSASAQKPAGVTSGVALSTLMDNESLRFMVAEKAWERFFVDIGNLVVDIAREIAENDNSYSVLFNESSNARRIKWRDIDNENDPAVTRVFPISQLSKHPGLKLQQLTEWFNAGAIDLSQFKRLSGMPDLEAETELDTADVDIVDKLIDKMLLTGKQYFPEPTDDFDIIIKRGTKAINLARERDHDEQRIDVVRNYVRGAIALQQQQSAPPPGGPGAPGGPVEAAPAAPPPNPGAAGAPPMPEAFQ